MLGLVLIERVPVGEEQAEFVNCHPTWAKLTVMIQA